MKTFRRYHGYDYSLGEFIFITISTEPRRGIFGCVTEHGFKPSPLGTAVEEALRHVAFSGKGVKLCASALMPDHLHMRVYLARNLPKPLETLGQFMANFKRYSNLLAKRHGAATGPIWQKGYHTLVCSQRRMAADVDRYMANNAAKWWLMKQHPWMLRVREPIDLPAFGHDGFWRAIGDVSLLDGKLAGVRISQKVPEGDFPKVVGRYIEAVRQGFTIISTFVSPGERALMKALAGVEGARAIRVVPKPLADPYRPSGDEPPLFAAGRFLLLAPCSAPDKLDRPWLLSMNDGLAAAAKANDGGIATYAVHEAGLTRLKRL